MEAETEVIPFQVKECQDRQPLKAGRNKDRHPLEPEGTSPANNLRLLP